MYISSINNSNTIYMKSKKEDFTKHSEAINELLFEAKAMKGIHRMTLHTWRTEGVLEDKRDPEATTKWSYYSPLDVVWISILNELKKLRFTHAEMKAFKEVLFEKIKAEDNNEYPALEYYTLRVLLYNQPIYIIITYATEMDAIWILDEKDYFSKLASGEIENHTAILLHKAVKSNLESVYQHPDFSDLAGLNKEEIQILQILRNKNFRTIKILKRNGEMDGIEGTERIEDVERIEKLLKEGEYQNIEIKQQNGKIVSAHRTIRTNFKRK
ncbi:MerR family transcriptional regulator [Aquimarina muelleri]|uniref:MerR family transcriptional regulator n=1 Tax=Aquimarina muelleri TaxID=279356 RepID=UPI0012DF26E8|nr:MerR family transcriptional regulator [Aquimarina muelleri]